MHEKLFWSYKYQPHYWLPTHVSSKNCNVNFKSIVLFDLKINIQFEEVQIITLFKIKFLHENNESCEVDADNVWKKGDVSDAISFKRGLLPQPFDRF